MPGTDGQIVFEVTADGKHAIADIKELTRIIKQETKQWDDAAEEATEDIGNGFTSMLKKVGSAIAAAKIGQKLLEIGKEAINLASDLEEVQNVVDVTFGSDAGKIDTWAKNAASQFGLTETQAKKFTSTLGAMMKSSGLAGNQITEMSTDLAGLAADMTSFYNIDFETAFQKIRSGISGETEPLKQLGINMSVANLNAYALKQGLEKTFEQMSQGEQTMLRYQYMMDATADAQGDFARTSDGYANSVRLLETNLTSLKTNLGKEIVPKVSEIVSTINGLFETDSGRSYERRRTVLDEIADIDARTQTAIADITATKQQVDNLADALTEVGQKNGKLEEASDNVSKAAGGVSELAEKLNGVKINDDVKSAFESTLKILYENVDLLSGITGDSASGVTTWLNNVRTEAEKLDPEDAQAWATLMSSLFTKVPGLADSEEGKSLIEQLTQYYLSLGRDSAEAAEGLAKLGYGTEEIEALQAQWLVTCKELVKTMPGLSDIIDTNTGEIKGGIPAVREYADEWERAAKYEAEVQAIKEKKSLYEGLPEQSELAQAKRLREAELRGMLAGYGRLTKEEIDKVVEYAEFMADEAFAGLMSGNKGDTGFVDFNTLKENPWQWAGMQGIGDKMQVKKATDALSAFMLACYDYEEFLEVQPAMVEAYDDSLKEVEETYGVTEETLLADVAAAEAAAAAMTKLQKAANGDEEALADVTAAVTDATNALKELADYTDSVHAKILSSIDGVAKGFEKIETPMMKNAREMRDIQAQIDGLDSSSKTYTEDLNKLNAEMNKGTAQKISAQSMAENLKQQAEYMETYMENLRKARALGVSDAVLATLSDGSEESYDYLAALAEATPGEVEKINKGFEDVSQKKKALADELTGQQLTVDETYKTLAEAAKQAVAELDLEQEAADNAGKTVGGIARGISEKVPTLQTAVDEVIAQLERLQGFGIDFSLGNFGQVTGTSGNQEVNNGGITLYSHKNGLDWVPFDNYFARLHEGEAVLTAEENKVWQSLRNGTALNMDYDSLGGVMRDNIRPGGSVYLDGKVVGRVISDGQGSAYRSLQRSGWQQ